MIIMKKISPGNTVPLYKRGKSVRQALAEDAAAYGKLKMTFPKGIRDTCMAGGRAGNLPGCRYKF